MGTLRTRLGLIALIATWAILQGGCTSNGSGTPPPGSSPGGQAGQGGVAGGVDAGQTGGRPSQPTDAAGTNAGDIADGPTVADAANDAGMAGGDGGVQEQDYASLVNPWIETNKGRWFFSTPAA